MEMMKQNDIAERRHVGFYVEKEQETKLFYAGNLLNRCLENTDVQISFSPSRYQGRRKGMVRYVLVVTVTEKEGRCMGRKPVPCAFGMDTALEMERNGESKKEIASRMGISLATYYRKRKEFLS